MMFVKCTIECYFHFNQSYIMDDYDQLSCSCTLAKVLEILSFRSANELSLNEYPQRMTKNSENTYSLFNLISTERTQWANFWIKCCRMEIGNGNHENECAYVQMIFIIVCNDVVKSEHTHKMDHVLGIHIDNYVTADL